MIRKCMVLSMIASTLWASTAIADEPSQPTSRSVVLPATATTADWPAKVADDAPTQRALAGLPGGRRTLADRTFEIPGQDAASALVWSRGDPAAPPAIEINAKARQICLLHTAKPGEAVAAWQEQIDKVREDRGLYPPPPTAWHYTVRYVDGRSLPVAVRWNESVQSVARLDWNKQVGFLRPLTWADVAWTAPTGDAPGRQAAIYAMRWTNPRPDVAIASISIEPPDEKSRMVDAIALLGITVDTAAPTGRLCFVSPEGDDGAAGTLDEPWATIHHAAAEARPGDTVLIRGGIYFIDRIIEPAQSGTEGRWITYSAFPGESPIINGVYTRIDPNSRTGLFHITNKSYIRVTGLTVTNSACEGIAAKGNCEHIDFLHNTVHFTCNSGIGAWRGDEPESFRHVRAIGNVLLATCARKANILFHNNNRRGGDECLDAGGIADFEYAYNEIGYGDKESIDAKGPVRRGRIHHNWVYRTGSIYVDAWNHPVFEIEVDHNVNHDGYGGYKVSTESGTNARDIDVHHNVAFSHVAHGIHVTNYGESRGPGEKVGIRIHHNTVHNTGFGIWIQGQKVRDVLVANNIVTGSRQFAIATAGQDVKALNIVIENNIVDGWPENFTGNITPLRGDNLLEADPRYFDAEAGRFYPQLEPRDVGDVGALPRWPATGDDAP